jgi:hypothetical protein
VLCGIQWNCVDHVNDEELSVSYLLEHVLWRMFQVINAHGVIDRASEAKFQELLVFDGWIKSAQLMFSSSENYCLFVHKRYGGLVEEHLF